MLSSKQKQILSMFMEGQTLGQVAKHLNTTYCAVDYQMKKARRSNMCETNLQLVLRALARGEVKNPCVYEDLP